MDSEVLDRVPSLFLILGVIWALMEVISIVFIRDPTTEELQELRKVKTSVHLQKHKSTLFEMLSMTRHDMT